MASSNKGGQAAGLPAKKRPHQKSKTYVEVSRTFFDDDPTKGLKLLEGITEFANDKKPSKYTPPPASFGYDGGNGGGNGGGADPPGPSITLADVGGLPEQISFIKRSVLFPLVNKDQLSKWGFTPPKGIMFYGPPGCGKTLLAKAIAHELSKDMKTKVTFIYRKGGDCFDKFFGQSSANLREVFKEAERKKPSLIFFDEIDGLCPSRETSHKSCEAYATVVTTFLGMMDQIKRGEIFVIGATNRLEAVDVALRRPGRFDKELRFDPPDENGRINILKIHTKQWKETNKPKDDLLKEVAAATPGYPGAHLENLCTETSLCAIERYKQANGVKELTGLHLSKVVIEKQDWFQAIKVVGRPKTNLFGSAIYDLPPEVKVVEPLISGMIEAIRAKIQRVSSFQENYLNMAKSFVIWELNADRVVNNYMIPSLLSSPELQKVPVYQLTLESLHSNVHYSIGSLVSQVVNSLKSCILFLPRFDTLCKILGPTKDRKSLLPYLATKLELTRSRPVLLLATTSINPKDLPDEFQYIFPTENSYKTRVPYEDERRRFFQTVLNFEIYDDLKPEMKGFFQEAVEKCVMKTDSYSLERVIDLHSELSLLALNNRNNEKLFIQEITKAIDSFRIKD